MAGLGYKSFASGEVLTAANLQGYAVDQSVMKFATTAARTAALAAPSQGMMSWIDATGSLEIYYELYNASTNTGGAKTAGWYPACGQALFHGTATRTTTTATTHFVGESSFAYTELYDAYGWHDASANPTRITPTKEGLYRVTSNIIFAANATGDRIADIQKNGATVPANDIARQYFTSSTSAGILTMTVTTYMNGSTDYVAASCYQSSGGNLTVNAAFTVEYIRPSSA